MAGFRRAVAAGRRRAGGSNSRPRDRPAAEGITTAAPLRARRAPLRPVGRARRAAASNTTHRPPAGQRQSIGSACSSPASPMRRAPKAGRPARCRLWNGHTAGRARSRRVQVISAERAAAPDSQLVSAISDKRTAPSSPDRSRRQCLLLAWAAILVDPRRGASRSASS